MSVWICSWTSSSSAASSDAADDRRHRAPVLVDLEPDGAGADLLEQRLDRRGRALAEEAEVEREVLGGLEHAVEVGRARGADPTVTGPSPPPSMVVTPAEIASSQRPGAVEVDVDVDAAGRDDVAFGAAHVRVRADDQVRVDAVHDVGVARLADPAIRPSLIPMSALTIPWTASITSAFVITKSSAPCSAVIPRASRGRPAASCRRRRRIRRRGPAGPARPPPRDRCRRGGRDRRRSGRRARVLRAAELHRSAAFLRRCREPGRSRRAPAQRPRRACLDLAFGESVEAEDLARRRRGRRASHLAARRPARTGPPCRRGCRGASRSAPTGRS